MSISMLLSLLSTSKSSLPLSVELILCKNSSILLLEHFCFVYGCCNFYIFIEQYGVLLNPTICLHQHTFSVQTLLVQGHSTLICRRNSMFLSFNLHLHSVLTIFKQLKKTFHRSIRIQCAKTQLNKTKNIKGIKEYIYATYSTF